MRWWRNWELSRHGNGLPASCGHERAIPRSPADDPSLVRGWVRPSSSGRDPTDQGRLNRLPTPTDRCLSGAGRPSRVGLSGGRVLVIGLDDQRAVTRASRPGHGARSKLTPGRGTSLLVLPAVRAALKKGRKRPVSRGRNRGNRCAGSVHASEFEKLRRRRQCGVAMCRHRSQ